MKLHELHPAEGSTHSRKRVGRGTGSGHGKTSGRGHKGQNSRSGGGVRPGYEGGQTPLFKRLPKRGFTNVNRLDYAIVNVEQLNCFENGAIVDIKSLQAKKIIKNIYNGVKVLGNGKLNVNLTVKAKKFSKSAKEAIEQAGGKIEVI